MVDWAEFAGAAMMFLEVTYDEGGAEEYFAPFLIRDGALLDALQDDAFCAALLSLNECPTHSGKIRGEIAATDASPAIRRGSAEQSNSSIIYGDRLILKLFRRQQAGPNPDIEIGRYLTEVAGFDRIPRFEGSIEYLRNGGHRTDLAIVQGFAENEGDGWTWTTDELERYFETASHTTLPPRLNRRAITWARISMRRRCSAAERRNCIWRWRHRTIRRSRPNPYRRRD